MTEYDMEILAKTIFGEARGESQEGQIAVACCVFNRFKSGKWFGAKTIAGVCLKPWQFSCWNKNDPNSQKIMALTFPVYSKYFSVIEEAKKDDITKGATHYYNPSICNRPKWAEGRKPCVKIGKHLFFKDID